MPLLLVHGILRSDSHAAARSPVGWDAPVEVAPATRGRPRVVDETPSEVLQAGIPAPHEIERLARWVAKVSRDALQLSSPRVRGRVARRAAHCRSRPAAYRAGRAQANTPSGVPGHQHGPVIAGPIAAMRWKLHHARVEHLPQGRGRREPEERPPACYGRA